MPVSQKPRKTRHKTPPKPTPQMLRRKQSPIVRGLTVTGISVLVVMIGLLAVTSFQRKEQAAENKTDVKDQTTTTLLDPPGGVPCPDIEGTSARRDAFPPSGPPTCLIIGRTYKARVTTDVGTFLVLLDPAKAPRSVNSFVVLARYHFYDADMTFHKAKPGFFVQTGDPTAKGVTGPGYTFDDAVPARGAYVEGSVAMANQGAGKNGSQFLVLSADAPALNNQYPLFGQVVEGIDVVKKIAADGADNAIPKIVHRLLKVTIIET